MFETGSEAQTACQSHRSGVLKHRSLGRPDFPSLKQLWSVNVNSKHADLQRTLTF